LKKATDIIDTETRLVRVMEERCTTCVFRPGNPMSLREGQLQDIVRDNLKAGALLTCHQTLPYNKDYDEDPAACHGFWDSYGMQTVAGILARFSIGVRWIKQPKRKDGHGQD
jgi:hypothetical protein